MKRFITAAEDVNPVDELIDIMEDDFAYFTAGLDKLQRDGGDAARSGYQIALQLNDAIQLAIGNISQYMQGE